MGDTYASTWQVLTPDPSKRMASEGSPVMAGAPLLLMHCATNQNLCCEPKTYNNDFGQEKEVSSYSDTSNRACYGVQQMREGVPNNLAEKRCSEANVWILSGA